MKLLRNHSSFVRIAHISDLHFSKITLSPTQFLNKRWIGNLNLIMFRRKMGRKEHLQRLPDLFKDQKVDLVIISGDLSSTSMNIEFKLASQFVNELKKRNIACLILPGNHDHYTKEAFKQKLFYKYFSNDESDLIFQYTLKNNRLEVHKLTDKWWIVALDTVIPTPMLSSQGIFSKDLEKLLEEVLQKIPDGVSILLVNHFPFFQHDSPHNRLVRGPSLKALLRKYPQVKFYLHGHTHRQCSADLRASELPIIFDAGCCGNINKANWHLLDLSDNDCTLQVFEWNEKWSAIKKETFSLTKIPGPNRSVPLFAK